MLRPVEARVPHLFSSRVRDLIIRPIEWDVSVYRYEVGIGNRVVTFQIS